MIVSGRAWPRGAFQTSVPGPVHIPVLRIKSPYEFPHRRLDFQKSFGARDGLHRGSLQNRRANIARMCG